MSERERHDALEDLVVDCFKQLLLMEAGEELPLDQGFFDLGLTSLKLSEARAHLEEILGLDIDATVLFSQPTVEQLVSHLAETVATTPTGLDAAEAAAKPGPAFAPLRRTP